MPATFQKRLRVKIPIDEVLDEYIKTKGTAQQQAAWAAMRRANIASIYVENDDLVVEANEQTGV